VKPSATLALDSRRAQELAAALVARRPGYLALWEPPARGAGAALVRIWARYLEAVLERLNRAPQKNALAFLELLGIELIPARPARAAVVFRLSETAPAIRLPAASQVAAPPPPETPSQVVFETERALGLSAARLSQVVSMWPGRDQYLDHSAAFLAGETIRTFDRPRLKDTPHVLYLAHDTLLALAGSSRLEVEFELSQGGSEPLDLTWEYWDGKVWRGFKQQHPQCAETDEEKLDGTAGLTRSGKYRLETDCAETAKTKVGEVEACWIRGKLDEPLPVDPDQILPEATQIRLSAVIERGPALKGVGETYRARAKAEPVGLELVCVLSATDGLPVAGAQVGLVDAQVDTIPGLAAGAGTGIFHWSSLIEGEDYTVRISLPGIELTRPLTYRPHDGSRRVLELAFRLELGLPADAAFADAETVDLSKPFYPFGQQPRPGSVFYFASEEVFSKPGARLSLHVRTTATPQDRFDVTLPDPSQARQELDHRVTWEYWNGREWSALDSYTSVAGEDSPKDFTASGELDLVVPEDLTPVKVNDEEGRWLRARLVSGGYGFIQHVTVNSTTVTYVIPRPPALADLRVSYVWEHGPFHAERVLSCTDFRYADHTAAAKWPDLPFQPFRQVADQTPALYLGFDRQLPVDRLNLYFDLVEQPGETTGPALVWEYWRDVDWRLLRVEDETRELAHPGMVSFIGPDDAASLARFGEQLYWLRARLKEDAPPPEREIRGIHPNAAWVSQWQTVTNETVGTGTGLPGQVFVFRRIPVLEDERLEVRESPGPRAAVEWRLLAAEVLREPARQIRELEERLGSEGSETDLEEGDLRLVRDRHKRVSEVWVRWQPRRHLLASGAGERHYAVERARGRLTFGDGEHGKIPPLGAQIRARQYRTGGGRAGNVAAGAISQALTGVAGVEKVFNPAAAEGGADAETLEALVRRGPRTLRHRGRALLPADFETLAFEASAAVAVARALPTRDAAGRERPGWVTLVIVPRSEERRPWPSFGLRERVRRFVEARADAGLAAAHRLHVTGPDYRQIDVEAALAPRDPAAAGAVEAAARAALGKFLHPLTGGAEGGGWEPGRDVYLSDVAAVLERVAGVDYVRDLALSIDGRLQGERARVPDGKTVVAGDVRLKLILAEEGP